MIRSFGNQGTADIWHGRNTSAARKTLPRPLWKRAQRKLDMIDAASELRDLSSPPANRLEKLKGDLEGWYSIRINEQYRVVFQWKRGHAYEVVVCDYH